MTGYPTIVADPPWPYASAGAHLRSSYDHRPNSHGKGLAALGAGSEARYGSMSMEDLCALQPPAAENAHLYLWTTNAFMCEAHDLARAWGFAPKTILTWVKMQPKGEPSQKTGYYFRGATEHIIFGVRGSLRLRTTTALPTAFLWPRTPHSVKPDAFYDLVEQASHGPYLELFARRARFGWAYWGDESLQTEEVPA